MEDDLTLKQRIVLWAFTFISLSSIFIIGIILNSLVFCFLLFVGYSIINVILIRIGKKEHAPTVRICKGIEIDSIFMCYIVSNFMFFICMVIMKYSAHVMGPLQAGVLGMILIAFASLVLSGIFYWKPKGASNHQKEIDYVKYNPISPDLTTFENKLKSDGDNLTYMTYEYIFKQGLSWEQAASRLQIETPRLTPIVEKVAFGIRLSCRI